jgi:hypothetical protein
MGSIIMLLSLLAPIAAAGQSSVALVPGWNLVGNGIEAPITATSFNDATKVTTIWKWVTSGTTQGITYPAWAFYTPTQNDGGQSYAASKGCDFLTTINAGEGFWVNAKATFTAQLPAGTAIASTSFQTMAATVGKYTYSYASARLSNRYWFGSSRLE